MEYNAQLIDVSIEDKVALVTLNDPEHMNGMSYKLQCEIPQVFDQLRIDPEVGAIVLTGTGRAFSAGGDLNDMKSGPLSKMDYTMARVHYHHVMQSIYQIEKPIICAMNGVAAGGGGGLALLCDFIYASKKARYVTTFTKIGAAPSDTAVVWLLPRVVGMNKAKELMMTNEMIDADEMLRIGLAQKVFEPEDLIPEAMKTAKAIAAGPGLANAIGRNLANRAWGMSFEQYLDYEALSMHVINKTNDLKEGVAAFVEKRRPNFTGE